MKNHTFQLMGCLLLLSIYTYAQNYTTSLLSQSNSPNPKNIIELPLKKAREKYFESLNTIQLINKGKSVDSIALQTSGSDFFEKYYQYDLEQIEKAEINEIKKLIARSRTHQRYSIFKSGACLVNTSKSQFYQTTDINGHSLITFQTDSIRSSPRFSLIDDFSEGYCRIKKDGVFGFLDVCGNEMIAPQYDYAERFNNGKALVNKMGWFFVNTNGEEGEKLNTIKDATALKFGISVVKLTNGKAVLIDNDYDKTQKPISEEFDEITPLTDFYLIVKEDKKYGLIRIDGQVEASILYDSISLKNRRTVILSKNKQQIERVIEIVNP